MYLVFEVLQDTWCSNKENPSAYWNAALSCAFMASNYANSLDADHALEGFFLSDLVLQACISFCSVSDKSGASLFLPCSHKNVVAHMLVTKKVPRFGESVEIASNVQRNRAMILSLIIGQSQGEAAQGTGYKGTS